jgi:hypothetical protein
MGENLKSLAANDEKVFRILFLCVCKKTEIDRQLIGNTKEI